MPNLRPRKPWIDTCAHILGINHIVANIVAKLSSSSHNYVLIYSITQVNLSSLIPAFMHWRLPHVWFTFKIWITGENGYTCEICSKAFNRKSRLDLHVKYVHEGAKPFECTECNKTFVRREDMARHTVLHSGLKAHKCPICDKSFAMKSSLKIHLLTHTKVC